MIRLFEISSLVTQFWHYAQIWDTGQTGPAEYFLWAPGTPTLPHNVTGLNSLLYYAENKNRKL